MSDVAIRVLNLSKQYRIGGAQLPYKTLRESLVSAAKRIIPSNLKSPLHSTETTIWALNDVSFDIHQGEVVGIIGRNGAGKSTLLKVLAHITNPTKGRVEIHGRVGSLLEVGTGFHNELTGRENIYLNGAILGMKKAEIDRKFDEIVAFSEIEKFLDTPAKHYSSGMYMRLAFAVAAHLEPEILLVDEVLAVGDAEFQKKCLGKMGEVAKEGRTVLFVSHNMVAIEGLCSQAIVLNVGKITYSGNVNQCIDFYYKSGENNSQISIGDRVDRQGAGNVRTTSINILNKQRIPTKSISMGDDFSVELTVEGKLRSGVIGVLIGNLIRSQIIRGYTWENLSENVVLSNKNIIRCQFHNFPLIHGLYYIHIWIAEREGNRNQLEDYIENAAVLEITPKDIYGNGRILDSSTCFAFCKTDWEILTDL